MTEYVYFSGTRADAVRIIEAIPRMLAGLVADAFGIARGIQLRAGVALLSKIQQAFLVKSRGGTGDDGIKWAPLSPRTIAARRSTRAERRALGIGKGPRPSLDREQDARWRAIYWRVWQMNRADMGDGPAKRKAAAVAWSVLKASGAKTVLMLLGSRQVDIGRDTGELFRSLTPGVEDRPSEADGQVFRTGSGRVIVGTNKKVDFHRGNAAKNVPARPLWPEDGHLPPPWEVAVNDAVTDGTTLAIARVLQGVAV